MDADWSVELGLEDARLEVPWASADRRLRYVDVGADPAQIGELEEVRRYAEMGDFLRGVNSARSGLASAKCDVWESAELEAAEEIYGAAYKVGSYCDVMFRETRREQSFGQHETFVQRVTQLLRQAPELPASAELVVRRSLLRQGGEARDGFAITSFVLGYGSDQESARRQWGIALKLVANAMLQAARE